MISYISVWGIDDITIKMRICTNRNAKTVNRGRKDELSVVPKRVSYLFLG